MQRILAVLVLINALVSLGVDNGPRKPAARFLEIKGNVVIRDPGNYQRPAVTFGTVYADDRIVVGKGAQAMLAFRADGHVECITAASTLQVTSEGCRPKSGVEQIAMPATQRAILSKLSRGPNGIVQGGVMVARAAAPRPRDDESPENEQAPLAMPGQLRPILGSTVLIQKPTFSWPAVPKAEKYTLNVYDGGNRVWSAGTDTTRLEYSGEKPLKSDSFHLWEVIATIGGKPAHVGEGTFMTANDRQRDDAEALQKLLRKPDVPTLAVAALWYRQNDMIEEAIATFRQLAKLSRDPDVYRSLVDLCDLAGLDDEARETEQKAEELEKEQGRRKGEGG
jgi:hypothetical protein